MTQLLAALSLCCCSAELEPGTGDTGLPPIGGGETSDFGGDVCSNQEQVCEHDCGGTPIPLSVGEAIARGFAVGEDRAVFENSFEAEMIWASPSCTDNAAACPVSRLSLAAQLDTAYLVRYRANPGVDSGKCPGELSYRTLIRMRTADGRVKGSFYARLQRTKHVSGRVFVATATPDLRNFKGSLPIAIDMQRPHWSVMTTWLSLGAFETSGVLEPIVKYVDSSDAALALESAGEMAVWARLADAPGALKPPTMTLDMYTGSSPELSYEISVRADSDAASAAEISVTVDGESRRFEQVSASSAVSLGRFKAGTRVSAKVTSTAPSTKTSATILADDCVQAADFCSEADCAVHVDFIVAPTRACARPNP